MTEAFEAKGSAEYDLAADAKNSYTVALAAKREQWLVENIPGVKRARVIGRCELLQGDCLEIMQNLAKVDAVVTDPPYGIGESGQKNRTRANAAKHGDYKDSYWDTKPASADHMSAIKSA
ncbi:MAG: site-specific DNA-methyltransferase, partial [Sphingomonadales bacterium]